MTDPSTPSNPTPTAGGEDVPPTLNDGSSLAPHGVYGTGVSFLEWGLGDDFDLLDSPVGDFFPTFPTDFPSTGQINVYGVEITGFPSGIHFDVYNSIDGKTHSSFGPFSHDAVFAPEPSASLLFGVGGLIIEVAVRSPRGGRGRTRHLLA